MSLLFWPMILLGFGVACSTMLFFWFLHLGPKNATLLEIGRALGVVLLSGLYLGMGSGWKFRKEFIFSMIFLWGCRLAFFLFTTRVVRRPEDGRYRRLRQSWKNQEAQNFLYLFQVQAAPIVLFSLPALIVSFNKTEGFTLLELAGFFIWFVAFFGEAVADGQLRRFRDQRNNRGKTCRGGLWKVSRHPNYFFEWLLWCGLALFTLASPMGWVSLVCPALMYYFLTRVTGIPATEAQALSTRGAGYRNYQKTTSAFFPRFKQ